MPKGAIVLHSFLLEKQSCSSCLRHKNLFAQKSPQIFQNLRDNIPSIRIPNCCNPFRTGAKFSFASFSKKFPHFPHLEFVCPDSRSAPWPSQTVSINLRYPAARTCDSELFSCDFLAVLRDSGEKNLSKHRFILQFFSHGPSAYGHRCNCFVTDASRNSSRINRPPWSADCARRACSNRFPSRPHNTAKPGSPGSQSLKKFVSTSLPLAFSLCPYLDGPLSTRRVVVVQRL